MLFSLPPGSKFTLFPIYCEDKSLSHMKGNDLQIPVMANILAFVYTGQKLWTKTSVFNKNAQKLHIKLVSEKKEMA